MIKQKGYINGEFKSSDNVKVSISPIDMQPMGSVYKSSIQDIELAFSSARKSQPNWKAKTRDQRINCIEKFLEVLKTSESFLIKLLTSEIGKSISEAKEEILSTYRYIEDTIHEYYNIYIKNIDSSEIHNKNKSAFIVLEPLGVILSFSPFHSPLRIGVAQIISIIISGNCIVYKPDDNAIVIAAEIFKLLHSSGIPSGVVNLIIGDWKELWEILIKNKEIDKIIFSGKKEIGNKILKSNIFPSLDLEIGGNNAAIIFSDINIPKVAIEIIKGAFSYSGQSNIAIKRLIVHEDIKIELINEIKRQLLSVGIGSPLNDSLVGPLINKESVNKLKDLIDDATKQGAVIEMGGVYDENLMSPTILSNCTIDMDIVKEDQYGPVIPILSFKKIEEATKIANDIDFALSVSIFSSNIDKAANIGKDINTGSINVNGIPSRETNNLPFLGTNNSGVGMQGISYAINSCVKAKPYIMNKFKK
ncbi:MAG: aldehyde dehydrogenase family protein [Mycoplasma sp.]|nr:aldehyde dehydrogenase family protein [Mycoplasma sp.]